MEQPPSDTAIVLVVLSGGVVIGGCVWAIWHYVKHSGLGGKDARVAAETIRRVATRHKPDRDTATARVWSSGNEEVGEVGSLPRHSGVEEV